MGSSLVVSNQAVSPVPQPMRRDSNAMRSINGAMRNDFGVLARLDAIPFFCECDKPSCFSSIWMSVPDFDGAILAGTGWLLVEGHESMSAVDLRKVFGDSSARGSRAGSTVQ